MTKEIVQENCQAELVEAGLVLEKKYYLLKKPPSTISELHSNS